MWRIPFCSILLCSFTLFAVDSDHQLAAPGADESACTQEPGLAYEYYDYACPSNLGCQQNCCAPRRFENDGQYGQECGLCGIWMPEAPALFDPLAADPREISYSLSWRMYDRAMAFKNEDRHAKYDDIKGNNIIAVSYGDNFPLYRWFNVWPWCGQLQADLQGALWAVFASCHEYAPLINADYYVGIPLTYRAGCWSFRLRGYHISCHIGDEFMVLHPYYHRRNPSSEYLDFFASYLYAGQVRLYAGAGWAVTQDSSFKCGRAFAEWGTEIRPKWMRGYSCKNRFYSVPFLAMHFAYRDKLNKHIDATYALGYEWGKCSGLQRKARVFLEFHDGYSQEGQFCKRPTQYLSLKMTYSM